jgi:hypothetical protein
MWHANGAIPRLGRCVQVYLHDCQVSLRLPAFCWIHLPSYKAKVKWTRPLCLPH